VLYIAAAKYATADGGALQAQVPAGNGNGNIEVSEFFPYTLGQVLQPPAPAQPVAPAAGAVTGTDSVRLLWRRSTPAVTAYRLDLSVDSLFSSPVIDSSLADTTTVLATVPPYQTTWWRVRARNSAGWGQPGPPRSFTALPGLIVRTVAYQAEWNMLSNPVATPDDSVRRLFPGSVLPYGFAFDAVSGYAPAYRLGNGGGYWMKFGSAGTAGLTGQQRTGDTLAVGTGWNLIGSLSSPVAVAGLTSVPAGIVASDVYAYDGSGYAAVTTIEPGRAYWVKISAPGVLYLASGPGRIPLRLTTPPGPPR